MTVSRLSTPNNPNDSNDHNDHMTTMTTMTVTMTVTTMTVTMTVLQHSVSFLTKYGWSEADFGTRAIVSRCSMPVHKIESLVVESLLLTL